MRRLFLVIALAALPVLGQGVPLSYSQALFRASQAAPERNRPQTLMRVRQMYMEALLAREELRILDEVLREARAGQDQGERLEQAGQVAIYEVHQLQSFVFQASESLVRAESRWEVCQARLSATLGFARGAQFELAERLLPRPEPTLLAVDPLPAHGLDALIDTGMRQRPELQAPAASSTDPGGASLDLQVGYQPMQTSWVGMVSTSFPILDGGDAAPAPKAESPSIGPLRTRIELEIEEAWLGLREAERLFTLSGKACDHAAEALRLAKLRYPVGACSAGELLSSLKNYASANLRHARAASEQPLAQARVALAVGTLR